ncbi:class F sortase [Streptomyces sp. NBC_01537]|uniref:class F sortase n=1 Tax=Streptomyces sp. NBC_01537 TaxID=2903896 RepID=UPI00386475D4
MIRGLPGLRGLHGRGRTLAGYAATLILLVAWVKGYVHLEGPDSAASAPSAVTAAANGDGGNGGRPAAVYAPHLPLPSARPVRVGIPSVGIDAPVVVRGLTTDGAVEPPPYDTPDVAGWYGAGPAPGSEGAAVIVGHVDTTTRPAVFYALSTVAPGALVNVTRTDGTVAEFTVEAVQVVDKAGFRPDRVYGSNGRPELRLITCGGVFDRAKQAYSANVVVYAALTGSTTRSGPTRS